MSLIIPSKEQLSADDLMIFAQVASSRSFTAAADKLDRPKSTVSRRISALEEQLGERLLIRTTRQMHLTEFGQQLLEHAQLIAQEVDAAWALSEQQKTEPSGRLRISLPSDFTNLFLTDMLGAFNQLYPSVVLELDLSSRRTDLIAEGFDLAVRIGKLEDDALLVAKRLALMKSGLYASATYLLESGTPQQPDDLLNHRILHLQSADGRPLQWQLNCDKQQWQQALNTKLQANTPELLMHLACKDAGIVALPHYFAQSRMNILRPVLPDWSLPASTVWALYPGRRLLPGKTRAFIDMLASALQGF